jgi:hypothetical protein
MIKTDMRFDVRTLDHRLRRGEISKKELNEHLHDLPDEAEEAEEVVTPFVATFEDRNYKS